MISGLAEILDRIPILSQLISFIGAFYRLIVDGPFELCSFPATKKKPM